MANKIGILITHGTDTMAWTLAYLKYALKNLKINLAITGAQLPISDDFPYSDGYENIKSSLMFLAKLKSPSVFSVFNVGEYAFSDSLRKVKKWDNNAFIGDIMLKMEWDSIKENLQNVNLEETAKPLRHLFLFTTGGTISAKKSKYGILEPGKDTVSGYINEYLGSYFETFTHENIFTIDSSDMTFEKLKKLVMKMSDVLYSYYKKEELFIIDQKFNPNVRIIFLDPYKKKADYERDVKNAKGIIVAGYGGGNVNLPIMLDLVNAWVEDNRIVVLSSQVPEGIVDSAYKHGAEPLKAGAVSGVDLSLVEIKTRLSYILGHGELFKDNLIDKLKLMKTLFLSGVKFRNKRSELRHYDLTGIPYLKEDLLINIPFKESLEIAIKKIEEEIKNE